MLSIALAMLVILVVCGLVVTYVAFPHRGEEVPGAPWLGDAMNRATGRLPLLQEPDHLEGPDHPALPGHGEDPEDPEEPRDRDGGR